MSEETRNTVIQPADFARAEPTGRKRLATNPALIAVSLAFVILALVALFMFSARAVLITTTPAQATLTISSGAFLDILPIWKIADRRMMQPGQYQVLAEAEGYRSLNAGITVLDAAEQDFALELVPLPGIVTVTTLPEDGAAVLIDQVPSGTTPITLDEVAAGARIITIQHPRYQTYQTELLVEGKRQQQSVTLKLTPAWAEISINSLPDGARVLVDGIESGTTPATLEVLEGQRELQVMKSGYKHWLSTISVQAQVAQTLPDILLVKSDGRLQISSTPEGASVTLAGRYQGQTPLSVKMPPGEDHSLLVTRAGYKPISRTIALAPDEDATLDLTLKAITGTIRVAASPAGARLFVNDEPRGNANQTLTLTARKHRIRIALEGYAEFESTVVPQPGLPQQLDVILQTEAEARTAAIPRQITAATGDRLKLIIPGAMRMGAARREPGRRSNETEKDVLLTRPYYLSEREISNQTYRQFDSSHESGMFGRALLDADEGPAVNISWEQAVRFCNWLSQQDGLPPAYALKDGLWQLALPVTHGYRLPTEAEWAWAARYDDAEMTRFPWGDTMPPTVGAGNYADVSAANMAPYHIAGYNDTWRGPAPTGSFEPNALGIHDLGGNVSEWVHDYYSVDPARETLTDPIGPMAGEYHVIRGSNYTQGRFSELRWTWRDYGVDARPDIGMRIARYLE